MPEGTEPTHAQGARILMDTWVQPTLFPLPAVNYFRPVPQIPSIPKQMTYPEWLKAHRQGSNEFAYTDYINIYHTEQILWERWCGHG